MDLQASKLYQCTKFGCSPPGHVEGVSRQKQIHRDLVCAFLGLSILNKSNCCPAFVVVVSLTINQRKINSFLLKREGIFFHQSLPPEAQLPATLTSSIGDSLSLELKFILSDIWVNTIHCIAHAALIYFRRTVGVDVPRRAH